MAGEVFYAQHGPTIARRAWVGNRSQRFAYDKCRVVIAADPDGRSDHAMRQIRTPQVLRALERTSWKASHMQEPGPTGVDATIWAYLDESIRAAARGDAPGHVENLLALERFSPTGLEPGIYVWYLLRLSVRLALRAMPIDPAQTDRMIVLIRPKLGLVTRLEKTPAYDTLRTAFDFPTLRTKVTGSVLLVAGTAIVGAISSHYDLDIDEFGPALERWVEQNPWIAQAREHAGDSDATPAPDR